jgi:electron transport complex protein RnfG
MVFALISALALALTNALTKEPIARQERLIADGARAQLFPEADAFEKLEAEIPAEYADLDEVHAAKQDGAILGYTFLLSPYGYKGDIIMTLGIDASGAIGALYINSLAETAGLGSRVADEAFLSQFRGVAANADAIQGGVDAITGATVSSKAVITAVQTAARYAEVALNIAAK